MVLVHTFLLLLVYCYHWNRNCSVLTSIFFTVGGGSSLILLSSRKWQKKWQFFVSNPTFVVFFPLLSLLTSLIQTSPVFLYNLGQGLTPLRGKNSFLISNLILPGWSHPSCPVMHWSPVPFQLSWTPLGTGRVSKVSLEPSLLQAEHPQLSVMFWHCSASSGLGDILVWPTVVAVLTRLCLNFDFSFVQKKKEFT